MIPRLLPLIGVVPLLCAPARAKAPDLAGAGPVLDAWITQPPAAMLEAADALTAQGWTMERAVKDGIDVRVYHRTHPTRRLVTLRNDSQAPLGLVFELLDEATAERALSWARGLTKSSPGVVTRARTGRTVDTLVILPRVIIAIRLDDLERRLFIAPRRGMFPFFIDPPRDALVAVRSTWREPTASKATLARRHAGLRKRTTAAGQKNPPWRHARSALEELAELPGLYGAQLARTAMEWLGHPDDMLDRPVALAQRRLGCPKKCRIPILGPQRGAQTVLLKRCGTRAMRRLLKGGREKRLWTWQLAVAALLEREAARRGLADTPLHHLVLRAILEPTSRPGKRDPPPNTGD